MNRTKASFSRSTPGSHSLERGLKLLRVFRQGIFVMSNAELAERAGLPRPTVSRLTRSLVDCGFLLYDVPSRGYRLAPVCVSLSLAYRDAEPALKMAQPLMRKLAEGQRVNVGLAVADGHEMVYLDTVRRSNLGIFRRLSPGSRIPIAVTSLGCAFMAGMESTERRSLMQQLQSEHGTHWGQMNMHITNSLEQHHTKGYCFAHWSPGMGAVAAPVYLFGNLYAINVSFPVPVKVFETDVNKYGQMLLQLKAQVLEQSELVLDSRIP